jgi:hypothetical protein
VLQRLEGLSDREAADRFAFDVRWRYAAGVADTRCWSTSAPGCAARRIRTGSSG